MDWTLGSIAIILLIIGLVGQAFEMRKIRLNAYLDNELTSPSIFTNKNNFKWYVVIGAGMLLWFFAERI